TCRRDHLRPRANDQHGNYRIHFDLQTKNIIPWSTSTDPQFRHRLSTRLRYLIRPLLADQQTQAREVAAAQQFARLGVRSRLESVIRVAMRMARRAGFRTQHIGADLRDALVDPQWSEAARHSTRTQRDAGTKRQTADVFVLDRANVS